MEKIGLLCILSFLGVIHLFGQQNPGKTLKINENESFSTGERHYGNERKGSYIAVSLKGGNAGLDYKVYNSELNETGSHSRGSGFGLDVAYSYFFDNHWGITTGVGISRYTSVGKLTGGITDEKFLTLGTLTDNDEVGLPREFELRVRISNLEEEQKVFFVEIPLMATYQTRFGDDENWGVYAGAGLKLQIPVSPDFKINNGANSQLNVSGYYANRIPADMGAPSQPPVPQHGYGTITNPNASLCWDGNAKLKAGIAGTVDLGLLVTLDESTDLTVGGYLDYGFSNIKKNGNQKLFTAPSQYHPGADNNIGEGIRYNGMLNSDMTGNIKPVAFGIKVGVRFKL